MRVLFSSMRMTGHLRPLLPYANALLERGDAVTFAAPQGAAAVLRDAGMPHAVFGHPGDALLGPLWAAAASMSEEERVALFVGRIFADLNARAALPALRELIQTWKPDLIVRESGEFGSVIAAVEAGIPFATIATTNAHSEAAVIALATAPLDAIRADAGLATDAGTMLRAAPVFTAFPHSIDGVPAAGVRAPFRVRTARERIDQDRAVPDWAADDGRPLVFITFGTLAAGSAKNHALYRAALDAVARLPVRAVMSMGSAVDQGMLGAIPANVTVESWVDQRDVFPRAAALVCHGGSGTLLAGLAHGVPMAIAPLTADQPDNARLVAAAGASVTVLDRDAASLRSAIERSIGDAQLRAASAAIADEMAGLPTTGAAIEELARLAAH